MKKYIVSSLIASMALLLTACGPLVEIPSGHVAKIMTKNGLQEGIIKPSKLRLDAALPGTKPNSIIIAQAADMAVLEQIEVFMPTDQLELTFDVRGLVKVSGDNANADKLFSGLVPQKVSNREYSITMDQIYRTYAQNIIREVSRTVVTQEGYTIDYILANRAKVGVELRDAVIKALAHTPITVIDFGFAKVNPPEVVIIAQEEKKKREIELLRIEAEKQIAVQKANSELEVEKIQQNVELVQAETQVLVDKKLAEGVSDAFVMQRALKVWYNISTNNNKVLIMPSEAFLNPALMIGAVNKSLNDMDFDNNPETVPVVEDNGGE